MHNKYINSVLYIVSLTIPIAVPVLLSFIYSLDVTWILPIFIALGLLFCLELEAKINNRGYIWKFLSSNTRDKISFAISLILFFVLVTWGEPQKIRFLTILLRLILGFIVSASALLISVRAETRILIVRRFIFRKE